MANNCDCEEAHGTSAPREGEIVLRRDGKAIPKPVTFSDDQGSAFFEGDIFLGTTATLREKVVLPAPSADDPEYRGIGVKGEGFRWPNKTVRFKIDPNLPAQERVRDAITHWEANTEIRFEEITNEAGDHVVFCDKGGCWSMIGRRGGRQELSLGPGCTTGNAIHEIGHAVGLWHEQSRADRKQFITVVEANIEQAYLHNFDQHIADGIDLNEYDYGSIMHYPKNAFSKNGLDTLIPKKPAQIGQRAGLSPGDIAAVKKLYP
jgi:hypothetical protein